MRENRTPKNELLKRYISYISFAHSEEGKREFIVFPNPGAAIALHKNHGFARVVKNVFRTVPTPASIELLHTNRIDPVKVKDEGIRESITVVFRPLGVNHFFDESLDVIVSAAGGEHSYIDISARKFEGFAEFVFATEQTDDRLARIEEFLLTRFREKVVPVLEFALQYLMDFENPLSISEIARKVGSSPRNLSRLFDKHLALTPVEFRNICQFRYSLNRKFESGKRALKDIGYESNYSDASYMVRMYKKYTGLNPSAFFEKVTVDSNYVFLSL